MLSALAEVCCSCGPGCAGLCIFRQSAAVRSADPSFLVSQPWPSATEGVISPVGLQGSMVLQGKSHLFAFAQAAFLKPQAHEAQCFLWNHENKNHDLERCLPPSPVIISGLNTYTPFLTRFILNIHLPGPTVSIWSPWAPSSKEMMEPNWSEHGERSLWYHRPA